MENKELKAGQVIQCRDDYDYIRTVINYQKRGARLTPGEKRLSLVVTWEPHNGK